jgi:hypothetical protein
MTSDARDATDPHHATDDHGDDHRPADHAHGDGQALGPVDVMAWGAGALGVLLGLVVAFCFVLATGGIAAG